MARQTFEVGRPQIVNSDRMQWSNFEEEYRIMSNLVAGGLTAYLALIRVSRSPSDNNSLRTRSTPTGDIFDSAEVGPDLTFHWESSPVALIISVQGQSLVISGPNSSGNTASDTEEPYVWVRPDISDNREFIDHYESLNFSQQSQITITLDDDEPLPDISLSARIISGTPRITADITVQEPAVIVAPSFDENTGDDQVWDTENEVLLIGPIASGTEPITYSWSELPDGIISSDIVLFGTPTTDGAGSITLTATNSAGSAAWTFNYRIGDVAVNIPLSARIVSGLPAIRADITVRESDALLLSDFDTTGLEIDALALIRASAPPDIYADSDRGGTQTPLDGELGLSLGQTLISRMQTVNVFEQIRFNDNNNPQNLSMSTYFNEGGDGNDLTLYIQTSEGVISQVIADSIVGAGSDWIRIGIDQENRSLIGNISDGDLFIVAFARLETIAVPLSARITSGTPTIAADISIREPEDIALSARIVSGAPQIRADVSIRGPGLLLSDFDTTGLEVDALALIEAGIAPDVFGRAPRDVYGDLINGELGLSLTEEPVNAIRFRDSGSQAGGERISLHDNGLLPLSTYFGSDGDGMDLTLWVQTSEGSISFPVDGNIDRSGGNFVIFNVPSEHQSFVESIEEDERFILAFTRQVSVDIPLSARIVSGSPSISADISIREPGEIPLSARLVSGIPRIQADITIIEPEDIALSARIVSGVPQIRADITIRELEDITLSARIVSGSPIIRADISVITQVIVSSLFDRRASLLSVEIDNALLDHVLKTSTYNRPSGLSLGLSDRLPTLDNLFDISGGGYARQVINSGWTNAINRAIAFGSNIDFPIATQNQGTVSYFNITLNDILAIYGELDDPRVIFSGDQISINDDDLDISFNTRGGASDYLSNKLLDFLLRGANLPPPSSIYIALCSDSIDDDDTGDSIPELSGLGYSRILHNDWNDSEDRLSTNDGEIQFPRATGNWDIVVEYALIDSSNNGNLLMHRPFGSSVIVKDNDRLSFSDGELPIQLGPVFARAGLSSSSDEIGRGIIRGY